MARIEKRAILKAYLGGWRHKITGIEYLNAATQTEPPPKRIPWKEKYNRMVQTVEMTDGTTQSSSCHRASQTWRDDYYIPNEADKYMTVKPYESYSEMQLQFDWHARVIQRYYRAYRLMKYVRKCAQLYRQLSENCRRYEEEKAIAHKIRHKRNILRQTYPRSRADFDMLYSLIEKWRTDRLKDIKSRFFKASQRAENYRILEKTVEMFNHIDKHKRAIKTAYRKRKALRFLTVNCRSIRWNSYKGIPVEMITKRILKAREFKHLYDALGNRDASSEERIKLLITLKSALEAHNCMEAFDLSFLLDQEIALLNRRIKGLSLDSLNERIMHTYLNFLSMYGICGCECVEENFKGYELREKPSEAKIKFCRSCSKLFPYNRFLTHTRMKKLTICISCNSLRQRNIAHVDYDPYMFILNCVRVDETRRDSTSALSFIMQKQDIYHLVNHIWHGRSAVSKNMDLSLLRMIRYQKEAEWAPWNCILLTRDEADVHYRIDDPTMIYSECLINQIHLAHQIAKNHFKQLIIIEKDFRESCHFSAIQAGTRYKSPLTMENYDPSRRYEP